MSEPVQVFITCILDTFYPQIGEAVVRVLRRLGQTVEFLQDQTCCGQPAFNAGLRDQALPLARHTIDVFEKTRGPVVVPSGSCAAMIRHSYLELFSGDAEWLPRARNLAARTYEFSEYLVDVLGVVNVGACFSGRIAYHPSCHLLRELGVHRQPLALLKAVRGVEIVELPEAESCCGFGGVFSAEHPQISSAMLERKLANLEASQADWLVSCDSGCITHINGGLQRLNRPPKALHLAEILAQT